MKIRDLMKKEDKKMNKYKSVEKLEKKLEELKELRNANIEKGKANGKAIEEKINVAIDKRDNAIISGTPEEYTSAIVDIKALQSDLAENQEYLATIENMPLTSEKEIEKMAMDVRNEMVASGTKAIKELKPLIEKALSIAQETNDARTDAIEKNGTWVRENYHSSGYGCPSEYKNETTIPYIFNKLKNCLEDINKDIEINK